MSVPSARHRRTAIGAAGVLALSVCTAVAGATAVSSAITPSPDCPAAVPVADLVVDQPVNGLTVSRGTTPEPFTGTVVGVIDDGIAAGLDMIVVRLTSAEIDRVGGIWAGMSGSPVYDAGGDLIGAVSYGLAWGSSPVAGVTPAADMQAVLDRPQAAGLRPAAKVALPPATARALVASGAATQREAASGLTQLSIPLAVSGMGTAKRLAQATQRLGLSGVTAFRAGVASAATSAADIVPGGNLGASIAYGDFSAVATGTVTAVCAEGVMAFGHPMQFIGDSTYALHPTDAVLVQEDPLGSPFKVSNPGAPVGTVDQDRLAGLRGLIGPLPEQSLVRTTVTAEGRSRVGETRVNVASFLPDAAVSGLLVNQDRVFDHYGKGSAKVSFTLVGTDETGTPFRVDRTNRFVSLGDLSYETPWELGSALYSLQENDFAEVDVDLVAVAAAMSTEPRRFTIGKVEWRRKGRWVTLREGQVVRAKPGRWVTLRVTLPSPKNAYGTRVRKISTQVPWQMMPGSVGELAVIGGGAYGFGGEEEEAFLKRAVPRSSEEPASLAELIRQISSAPRNDEVLLSAVYGSEESPEPIEVLRRRNAGDVVQGARTFTLLVTR